MTKVFGQNEWYRRNFNKSTPVMTPPGLMQLQLKSYDEFLQKEVAPEQREDRGLQGVLKGIFPIYDFNKTVALEFVSYVLEEPKYSEKECRRL